MRTGLDGKTSAHAIRGMAESAAAPMARCRNCRRGNFILLLFRNEACNDQITRQQVSALADAICLYAGLLHDLAPARDLRTDERFCSSSGVWADDRVSCRSWSSCACTSGIAMMAFNSPCSLFTISRGVPAGARMIDQLSTSKPGTASAIGGISGASASRSADDHAENLEAFRPWISGSEGSRGREHQRNAPGDDIDDGRRGAVIGNMTEVGAGCDFEQLGKEMLRRRDTGRRVEQLAGVFLGEADELRDRIGWKRFGCDEKKRVMHDERDRREIPGRVEWRLLVQRAGDRERAAAQHQCVAVRGGPLRLPPARSPRRRRAGSRSRSTFPRRSPSLSADRPRQHVVGADRPRTAR